MIDGINVSAAPSKAEALKQRYREGSEGAATKRQLRKERIPHHDRYEKTFAPPRRVCPVCMLQSQLHHTMGPGALASILLLLCFTWGPEVSLGEETEGRKTTSASTQSVSDDSSWSLNAIRESFQAINGYFDSVVELMGGRNGVCQYRCRYGKAPLARPEYKNPEPNGCSLSLLGYQLDIGIPAMTKCCNQLDMCYDTCGSNKYRCDSKFRWCLHGICSDLKRSLGFVSKVEACETLADTLYNAVWTLGCRPYMNSQRAACFCEGEEKDEL
ncbi:group XIIB secretory phospholipase A2-like protein isoform X2 [Arapaima gigas]